MLVFLHKYKMTLRGPLQTTRQQVVELFPDSLVLCFLPANLNGARYLDFLQNQLPVLLEDVPLDRRGNIIFQQDGCPAHYALAVREHLHPVFPDRWIGRDGPITWPPRSSDLTPLDFFLWGYIKSIVYKTTPRDVNQCQNRIRDAFASLDGDMVRRASQGVIRRAELVLQENGGHIEHLLH
ncbi:hypothetical protein TKK_0000191 [Trichogramma kaykai]